MKKIILLILDGFGIRQNENGNAIKMSNLPNLNRIMSEYPMCELTTSGEDVGLPKGVIGRSELSRALIHQLARRSYREFGKRSHIITLEARRDYMNGTLQRVFVISE